MGNIYFTYIMSNQSRRGYVDSTREVQVRVFKHKKGWYEGSFTAHYTFAMLVYFETLPNRAKPLNAKKRSRDGGGRRSCDWCSRPTRIGPI